MKVFRKTSTGISFERGRPVLDIFCRDQHNRREVVKVRKLPIYFYVNEDTEIEEDDRINFVLREVEGFTNLYGKPVKKIYVTKISECKRLGRVYEGYESDIKWDKKACLDLNITDMFVEHNGDVFTLDPRYNVLNKKREVTYANGDVVITEADDSVKELVSWGLTELRQTPHSDSIPFSQRVCVFDIEVAVDSKEDLRNRTGDLLCVSCWDSYTKEYSNFMVEGGNEFILVQKVLSYFHSRDFDIFTGWNVGFDMGWIIDKAEEHGLDLEIYFTGGKTFISKYTDQKGKYQEKIYLGGRTVLDSMVLYKNKTATSEKLASYSLKAVNLVEGGEEYEDFGAKVSQQWKINPDVVMEYCQKDVEATVNIINQKDLFGGVQTISKFYGCATGETGTNSLVIESMVFLMKGKRVLPNIVRNRDVEDDLVGAKVLKSTYGIHKNVGIFDAASLYPSIIQGLNISPECLVPEGETGDFATVKLPTKTVRFRKKTEKFGILPEAIGEMRKLREQIRQRRMIATEEADEVTFALANNEEKVAKGVLASVYGVMGYSEFRLFNIDCANAITAVARGMIKSIIDKLDDPKCFIVYGDTDSVFIALPDANYGFKIREQVDKITSDYVKSLGVDDKVISMNYEKFFRWILFNKTPTVKLKSKIYKKDKGAAKKKYIGYISYVQSGPDTMKEVNDLYYKGFELRRSDAAKALKVIMRQFFELMSDGDYMKSVEYLKQIKEEFTSYSVDYLSMPRGVNVEDADDPWANGKRYAEQELGFEFDKNILPRLVHVKPLFGKKRTTVICYHDGHEFPKDFEVDYNIMFDKLIKKKFEPIIESMGLFWDTAIGKQGILDGYF